jgi:hypothetical protein
VIRRAMAKDPRDRFPSAGDLGRAALAAVRHEAVTQPERAVGSGEAALAETARIDTAPTPVRKRRPRRRRRRLLTLTALLAVLAALAAAVIVAVPRLTDGGGNDSPPKPTGIEVPSLAGLPLDVAEQRLDDLGLQSSENGGGLFGVILPSDWDVCQTSPPAGANVRRGSTVELLIDRPDIC